MSIFSIFQKDPSELLKKATEEKKTDINKAIETLRRAYKAISRTSMTYKADTFLRLPLYLQEAGRQDEAWAEFNTLLVKGHPNLLRSKELMPMNHSAVYDKMRLFLQREKRYGEAVKYGVFSELSWCIGLHHQKRNKELRSRLSKESIDGVLSPLLKKAKKEGDSKAISEFLLSELGKLPKIDFSYIGKEIDRRLLS